MRRRRFTWQEVAVVIALLLVGGVVLRFGVWGKYYRSYVGCTEAEVLAALEPPFVDSRDRPDYKPGESYWLGWYFALGRTVSVEIRDGVVVHQAYGGK